MTIRDSNDNEWTWIVVPKSVTANAKTDGEIESALIAYAGDYRGDCLDTWYNGCGLEEQEYTANYSKMLQSIKTNGGFYIGKYEVGIKEDVYRNYGTDYATEHPIDETPVIQQDKYVYNWIRCSQAEEIVEELATGGRTSTLMFGIQWDLVLKYLEINGDWDTTNGASYYLKTNSGTWGNYSNETFDITRGRYSGNYGADYTTVNGIYPKPASGVLLTTGATDRNSKMNIYDLAGNVYEWTLEKATGSGGFCVSRGGYYYNDSSGYPASDRRIDGTSGSGSGYGCRPALY